MSKLSYQELLDAAVDLDAENEKLKAELAEAIKMRDSYREMFVDSNQMLMRLLRGEALEGWIDPKLEYETTPESAHKLLARLQQSKTIANERWQRIKALTVENAKLRTENYRLKRQIDGLIQGVTGRP